MSFFGPDLRNGLPIGLGTIASLASRAPAAAPPPAGLTVLDSAGASYSVPLTVLDSAGASYTVSSTVLSSNGTAYVV